MPDGDAGHDEGTEGEEEAGAGLDYGRGGAGQSGGAGERRPESTEHEGPPGHSAQPEAAD